MKNIIYIRKTFFVFLITVLFSTLNLYSDNPLNQIIIYLESDNGSLIVASGVTDNKGTVKFDNIKPGKYTVTGDFSKYFKEFKNSKKTSGKTDNDTITISITLNVNGKLKEQKELQHTLKELKSDELKLVLCVFSLKNANNSLELIIESKS